MGSSPTKEEEETEKLELVSRHLDGEDNTWQWSSKPAYQVAHKTLLVHPDRDVKKKDVEDTLKSTYDEPLETAIFSADANLDAIRDDPQYLTSKRWYDWPVSWFVQSNRVQRFFGDVRVRNLDSKVQCQERWARAEAHRGVRNRRRQQVRLAIFLVVYAVLFAVPVAEELLQPVTSEGCSPLAEQSGVARLETSRPCHVHPHSSLGFACAVAMLLIAKAATMSTDCQWFKEQFPAICGEEDEPEIDVDVLKDVDREWQPCALLLGLGLSVVCWYKDLLLPALVVGLWAVVRLAMAVAESESCPHTMKSYVKNCGFFVLCLGEFGLALASMWGPLVAGFAFVGEHYAHFNQGVLEVVPASADAFVIKVAGTYPLHESFIEDKCLHLKQEEVVHVAYAYFGAAHMVLFMLGAATLSIAELMKLKEEDSYLLRGWVDIGSLLALNEALTNSEIMSSLTEWRNAASDKLAALEKAANTSADCLDSTYARIPDETLRAQAKDSVNNIFKDLRKAFDGVLPREFKSDDPQWQQVFNVVMTVDLEAITWPSVVTALGFAFWGMMKGTLATPCLQAPADPCTTAIQWAFGWMGICGADASMLGMETLALLFVVFIAAMLTTSRIELLVMPSGKKALKALLAAAGLVGAALLFFTTSGLGKYLHLMSVTAMPPLHGVDVWMRDAFLLLLLVGVASSLVVILQGLGDLCPCVRSWCPSSPTTMAIFVLLVVYTVATGALDILGQGEDEDEPKVWESGPQDALGAAGDLKAKGAAGVQEVVDEYHINELRFYVYEVMFFFSLVRLLAKFAQRMNLMTPSFREANHFVEHALKPEVMGLVDDIGAKAMQMAAAVGSNEAAAGGGEDIVQLVDKTLSLSRQSALKKAKEWKAGLVKLSPASPNWKHQAFYGVGYRLAQTIAQHGLRGEHGRLRRLAPRPEEVALLKTMEKGLSPTETIVVAIDLHALYSVRHATIYPNADGTLRVGGGVVPPRCIQQMFRVADGQVLWTQQGGWAGGEGSLLCGGQRRAPPGRPAYSPNADREGLPRPEAGGLGGEGRRPDARIPAPVPPRARTREDGELGGEGH